MTLACPTCGAAVSSQASSCGYCSAPLAVQPCPRCFGLIFAGSRFCGHCGARADDPAQPLEKPNVRRCPRCSERPALEAVAVGDMTLDRCARCGGLFVDSPALDRAILDRDQRAKVVSSLAPAEIAEPGRRDPASDLSLNAVKYLSCPECDALMARKNFGRRSGVIIDTCSKHGVWFDYDELRQVLEFVERGGLDLARKAEIEELDRQVRAKRAALAAPMTSSWEAKIAGPSIDLDVVVRAIWRIFN